MDSVDESGYSADSTSVSEQESVRRKEDIVPQAEEIVTKSVHTEKSSVEIRLSTGQGCILDKAKISFSSGSRSSTDSEDTVIDPRNSHVRGSEPTLNNQPEQSSNVNKNDQPYSVASSCEATDITHESTLMSPRQCPPLQVMERSANYEPGRISSSVFTANSTPQEWSLASNESLFSLHVGTVGMRNGVLETGDQYLRSSDFAFSDEVMISNRTSMVAGQEAARSRVETGGEQAKPSSSDKISHDILLQKIQDLADTKTRIPETSWDPRKNIGKVQPLPTTVNKKPEKKSSSCCKKSNCCLCSCASMSCCCPTSDSCCSKLKCSCSCSNCSLSWCCKLNCCSKKSCCSCPKRLCCMSCNQCSKALCCWNWSCWKLFYCWNWTCCSSKSCCRSWSCCSKVSCCKPWSSCPKISCCKPWICCSNGACCGSLECCSIGSCCKNWNCCSNGACCGSWKCCSLGSCCKSLNCFPMGSCGKSWNCCSIGSCCSWKCGSCCKDWNCCSNGFSCCKSFKINLCCFSSSNKIRGRGVDLEMAHHHHKTKTLGRTGICNFFTCSGCSCCPN